MHIIIYILNCYQIKVILYSTPYEAWFGKKINLLHLQIFGFTCYLHVHKENKNKLDKYTLNVSLCDTLMSSKIIYVMI